MRLWLTAISLGFIRFLAAFLDYHQQRPDYLNSKIYYQESYRYHLGHLSVQSHNEQVETRSIEALLM